jgi:hypothetical protein
VQIRGGIDVVEPRRLDERVSGVIAELLEQLDELRLEIEQTRIDLTNDACAIDHHDHR